MIRNNNLHLIPAAVIDIANRLNNKDIRENERQVLLQRLEHTRDYCSLAINKYSKLSTFSEPRRKSK